MSLKNPENLERILASEALDRRYRSHLRLAEPADAELICALRSDPHLNSYLSATPPEVEAQRKWLDLYKQREASGEEFYFIICCEGKDVGVVRIYDLREIDGLNSFSWGSWIIRPPRPSGIVTFSAVMMYEIGFDVLGFDRAHFEVLSGNVGVIDFHKRAGAVLEAEFPDKFEFAFWPTAWETFRRSSLRQITEHRTL